MESNHSLSWRALAEQSSAARVVAPKLSGPHAHFWARGLSRRNFIAGAAGAAGLAMTPGLALPTLAEAEGNSPGLFCSPSPTPITGGTELLGMGTELFHLFLPGPGSEPSTIGNFKGCIGLAAGHGTGTITQNEVNTPVTFANDTRFMTGTYVGQDGKQRKGTFVFVWLDLFSSQDGSQINDFNYGITGPGLFWTAFVPTDAISVNVAAGTARMCLTDSFVIDAHCVVNALTRGPVDQASVSFVVHWENPTDTGNVRDEENKFNLNFVSTSSRIEWSAVKQGFKFVSDPSNTSVSDFSELGNESNGVFFF